MAKMLLHGLDRLALGDQKRRTSMAKILYAKGLEPRSLHALPPDLLVEARVSERFATLVGKDQCVGVAVNMTIEVVAQEIPHETGRIALPLSGRGVPVHGIDLSKAMVARVRPKPGAERIEVSIGDFATTRVTGSFSLVYLVFNGIMNLTTQEAQVECFGNGAAHLATRVSLEEAGSLASRNIRQLSASRWVAWFRPPLRAHESPLA